MLQANVVSIYCRQTIIIYSINLSYKKQTDYNTKQGTFEDICSLFLRTQCVRCFSRRESFSCIKVHLNQIRRQSKITLSSQFCWRALPACSLVGTYFKLLQNYSVRNFISAKLFVHKDNIYANEFGENL